MTSKAEVERYVARSGISGVVSEAVSAVVSRALLAGPGDASVTAVTTTDIADALARQLTDMVARAGIQSINARVCVLGAAGVGVCVRAASRVGACEARVSLDNAPAFVAPPAAAAPPAATASSSTGSRPSTAPHGVASSVPAAGRGGGLGSADLAGDLHDWSSAAAKALSGVDPCDQLRVDDALMGISIPGKPDVTSRVCLCASMAVARLGAKHAGRPLAAHIAAIRAGRSIRAQTSAQRGVRAVALEGKEDDASVDAFAHVHTALPRLGFNLVAGGAHAVDGLVLSAGAWLPVRRHLLICDTLLAAKGVFLPQLSPLQRSLVHGLRTRSLLLAWAQGKGAIAGTAVDGAPLISAGITPGRSPTVDDVLRAVVDAQHTAAIAAATSEGIAVNLPESKDSAAPPTARTKPAAVASPAGKASTASPAATAEPPATSPRTLANTAAAAAATNLGISVTLAVDVGADFLHVDAQELAREKAEADAAAAAAAAASSSKGKGSAKAAPAASASKPSAGSAATGKAGAKGKEGVVAAPPAPAWAAEPLSIDLKGVPEDGLATYDLNAARYRATSSIAGAPGGSDTDAPVRVSSARLWAFLREMTTAHPTVRVLVDPFAAEDWTAWKSAMTATQPAEEEDAPAPTAHAELVSSQLNSLFAKALRDVFSSDPATLVSQLDQSAGTNGKAVTHSASAAALLVSAARRHAAVADDVYKRHIHDWAACAHTALLSLEDLPTVTAAALVARYAVNSGMHVAVARSTRVDGADAFEADLALGLDARLVLCGDTESNATCTLVDRFEELAATPGH